MSSAATMDLPLQLHGGPTLCLRQQLRGSPDIPVQALAYNPVHRQVLSVDVDGGRRLWSLKGEVLYEPWDQVVRDDTDLQTYRKPPDVVLLRFVESMDCYLIIYRSQDWVKRKTADLSPLDVKKDLPLGLFLSPHLKVIHKFRPSMADPLLAVLSDDERFLVTYDSGQLQTFFSLWTSGGTRPSSAAQGTPSHPPRVSKRRVGEKMLARNDVRTELEEQGIQMTDNDDRHLLKVMALSPTDLLVGLFSTSAIVWRVSATRGDACTRLHFLPDIVVRGAFTSAAWTCCTDNSGQLATGCADGSILLWHYHYKKGLDLLASAKAHGHSSSTLSGSSIGKESLAKVAGIYPYPSPASERETFNVVRAGEEQEGWQRAAASPQRGVQGSFLSVGWDGAIVHWLAVQQVTTCDGTDAKPEEDDDSTAGTANTQQRWRLLELARRPLGIDPPKQYRSSQQSMTAAQRAASLSLPKDLAFLDLKLQDGTRGMVVCKSGGLLSIMEVFYPSFLFSRLPDQAVDMKRYTFSRVEPQHSHKKQHSTPATDTMDSKKASDHDSCYLATLSSNGAVQVYDTGALNATVLHEISLPLTAEPDASHNNHGVPPKLQPTCLDVSMERKYVVVGMDNGTVLAAWLSSHVSTAATSKSDTHKATQKKTLKPVSKTLPHHHGTPQALSPVIPITAISVVIGTSYALSGNADGTITLHTIGMPSLAVSSVLQYPAHPAPVMSIHRLTSTTGDRIAGQLASCGRAGLIKIWRVDRVAAPQPYVMTRPELRFVAHLQSDRPYTACTIMPDGCNGGGYGAICGYDDGMIEVLHSPLRVGNDYEQRLLYRAKSHGSKVVMLDYLEQKRLLISIALDQMVLIWALCGAGHPTLQRCLTVASTSPLPGLLIFSDAQTAVLTVQDRDLALLPLDATIGPRTATPSATTHPNPCLLTVDGVMLPSSSAKQRRDHHHRQQQGRPHTTITRSCFSAAPLHKSRERPLTYCAPSRSAANIMMDRRADDADSDSIDSIEQGARKTSATPVLAPATATATSPPQDIHGMMELRSTDESTISSWDHTSIALSPRGIIPRGGTAPSLQKNATAIKEMKRNFSYSNIQARRKKRQREREHRDIRETDILKDNGFRAAFVAVDEGSCGRVSESRLLSVLNGWWHKINDSVVDSLRTAMQECGIKDGEMLTIHRVAQVATQLLRLLGKAPNSVYLSKRIDTPYQYAAATPIDGPKRTKQDKTKSATIKPFHSMMRERVQIVYNEMGEARRVRVPLPEATMDTYRGLSRKEICQKQKEAKASQLEPQVSLCIPSRTAYNPVPTYYESQPARVFTSYWATQSKRNLPVPRGSTAASSASLLSGEGQGPADTSSPKHIMDRQALVLLVRSLLDHLTDVLVEGLDRGLLHRGLVTTENAVDALYKYYLLNLGIPDVVRSRLDSLYQSALFHEQEAACRLIIRLLGMSEDQHTYPPITDELRTLGFRALHWLKTNYVTIPVDHVITRRNALVASKQLLMAEEYGPRFLLDLQAMAYQLPDVDGGVPALDQPAEDEEWEAAVDVNVFLEGLLYVTERREKGMRHATETLFASLPSGAMSVSRCSPTRQQQEEPKEEGAMQKRADGVADSALAALKKTQKVLNGFLDRDPFRTGTLALEPFSHVVLHCLLSSAATGEEPILEVSTEQFNVLRVLVHVYREGADGTICYLDFWAMLFTESFRDGRVPPFLELEHKAKTHMLGIDDEQRHALLTYAGYYPQQPMVEGGDAFMVDKTYVHRSLINQSVLKELALSTKATSADDPGNLCISRPTLRMTRSCLSVPPPLGWPRYCHTLDRPLSSSTRCDSRPRSEQSVRAYSSKRDPEVAAELRQWDMSKAAADDVADYMKQYNDRLPGHDLRFLMRPASAGPEVDGPEDESVGGDGDDDSGVSGPEGAVVKEDRGEVEVCGLEEKLSRRAKRKKEKEEEDEMEVIVEDSGVGKYDCGGRATSPIKLVKFRDGERERLLDEIRSLLLPGQTLNDDLLTADKGRLKRYLQVLHERLRRKYEKEQRKREHEEKLEADRELMASLLRREMDFLTQEEQMIEDVRQKYRNAFSDDVEERRKKQEEAKLQALELLNKTLEEKRRHEEALRRKAEEERLLLEAQAAERARLKAELDATRRAMEKDRQAQKEDEADMMLEELEEARREEERRRVAAEKLEQEREAERLRLRNEALLQQELDREAAERAAMEAEEEYTRNYEMELEAWENESETREMMEAMERATMAREEQEMRDFLREEAELIAMNEEEEYQRAVEAYWAALQEEEERKRREFMEFVERVTAFTIEWAQEEMAAEDEAEAEKLRLEEEERERQRLWKEEQERLRKEEEARLMAMEIEDDLSASDGGDQNAMPVRPRKDGIMFFQPMSFAADIEFDPFHPLNRDWKGRDDGTLNTARSSEVSEDEIPKWLSQKEVTKFHQDFTTYGEDYKTWPPVFETAKVLWHEYFVDMEKRVLFPKEAPKEEHYLVRLERELLSKKKVIQETEQYWAAKAKEQQEERQGGSFSWRALHIKYTQSNRNLIHLPHGSIFTGEVDNDKLVYFRVDVPKACILTIMIKKLSGDVDVFVSKDTMPSILCFDWKMTSLESIDRLLIQPSDTKGGDGSYVVGVYAPGGTSRFSICASLSIHDTERAGAGTAAFNRLAARLRYLAKHSESGALLWNFEQISAMADEYLMSYSEVAKLAGIMQEQKDEEHEVSDEELLDSVTLMEDDELLELSDDDFAKAGVDLNLANQIETWRPNFDELRKRKGFKITLRQHRRLRELLRKKREKSGAKPDIASGFVKVYIPNVPRAQHYTVSRLDRSFRPDVVRAKDAAARDSNFTVRQNN